MSAPYRSAFSDCGIGPFIRLKPFILPPLIAVSPQRKQWVRSCG